MDASRASIGAVLSVQRDRYEHSVAYNRRKLSPAEPKYVISELRCLAIVASIQYFAVYLMGSFYG